MLNNVAGNTSSRQHLPAIQTDWQFCTGKKALKLPVKQSFILQDNSMSSFGTAAVPSADLAIIHVRRYSYVQCSLQVGKVSQLLILSQTRAPGMWSLKFILWQTPIYLCPHDMAKKASRKEAEERAEFSLFFLAKYPK